MQNAADLDRIKYQIMWGVAAFCVVVAFGVGLVSMAAFDHRPIALAQPAAGGKPLAAPPAHTGTVIKASVADFSIKLDRSTVPAGKMTFQVANQGPSFHEFVILKTDHPAGKIPMIKQEGYMRAAEDAKGDVNVAELGGIKVGSSKNLTTSLKPGHYVIVCNLPMHYKMGMWAAFTVTPKHSAPAQPVSALPKHAGTLIKSSVADFSIKLDRSTVPAGKMTFQVANQGPSFHEFVILKTNHPAGNLPMIKQEGYVRAAEDAKGDIHVAELGGIKVGSSKNLTTSLKPGHYVIVCNLPMHYKMGMWTALTVK
jgi:uncharacterized cupredoxin-like copper-binding protein